MIEQSKYSILEQKHWERSNLQFETKIWTLTQDEADHPCAMYSDRTEFDINPKPKKEKDKWHFVGASG